MSNLVYDIKVYSNGYSEITKNYQPFKCSKLVKTETLIHSIASDSIATIKTPILPKNTLFYASDPNKVNVIFTIPEQLIYLPITYRLTSNCDEHSSLLSIMSDGNFVSFDIYETRGEFYELDEDKYDEDYYYEEIMVGVDAIKPLLLPNLIVHATLTESSDQLELRNIKFYSYDDFLINKNTKLYLFPYGNQYDTYSMCLGTFSFTKFSKNDVLNQYDLRSLYTQTLNYIANTFTNSDLDYYVNDAEAVFYEIPHIIISTIKEHRKDISDTNNLMMTICQEATGSKFNRYIEKEKLSSFLMAIRKHYGSEEENYKLLRETGKLEEARNLLYNNLVESLVEVSQLII